MSEVKLKPCPFCGGEATTSKYGKIFCTGDKNKPYKYISYFLVGCENEECKGYKGTPDNDPLYIRSKKKAVTIWNCRISESSSEIACNAPNSGGNNSDK